MSMHLTLMVIKIATVIHKVSRDKRLNVLTYLAMFNLFCATAVPQLVVETQKVVKKLANSR